MLSASAYPAGGRAVPAGAQGALECMHMKARTKDQALYEVFPALAGLSETLRADLERAPVLTVPAGTVLFEDGGPCRAFPLLIAGRVRVAKASADGREIVLYRISPGQICLLTSSCLLGEALYPARGMTETATRLVAVGPELFHRMLSGDAAFRVMVFGLFAERMAELMSLVEEVAFGRLDRRLAALLAGRAPEVRETHQMLADELGSVRVVVSRMLREFEERGWVSLGRERILVRDAEALKRLSEL